MIGTNSTNDIERCVLLRLRTASNGHDSPSRGQTRGHSNCAAQNARSDSRLVEVHHRARVGVTRSAQATSHSHRRPLNSATEPCMPATRLTDRKRSGGGATREESSLPSPPTVQMCHLPRIQQAPCSGAPVRTTYNGPGHVGEWNTGRNQSQNRCTALHAGSRILANCPSLREPRLLSVAGIDRTFCSEPSCGSARLGWLPSSASPSFVMGVREFAPAAGGTAPTIGR
jgi:hypothetical protein